MDERISKALAELRRAGISPAVFAAEAARAGAVFTNDEVADFMWAVAEQRGLDRAKEELGPEGKSGKKPKKVRLAVVKWLELVELVSQVMVRFRLRKFKPLEMPEFRLRFSSDPE